MAHSVVYDRLGAPEVLHVIETADPEPLPGEVVVRVAAAGVNPIDAKLRAGVRPSGPITGPRRVGFDGAGTIHAVGAGVTAFALGDRVAVRQSVGTYATHVVARQEDVSALPDAVTFGDGAALGIPAGTAYQALRSLGVAAGDTLLVHAGSGAVGQAAVQFALAWGAEVIATAGPGSMETVSALGATAVAYGKGLSARVAAVGDVTVALDAAGTDEALRTSLDVVADRDRIATIVRGPDAEQWGVRAFGGGSPHPLTAQEEAWRAEALPHTIDLLARGAFHVRIGRSFALDRAADAHRLIEAGSPGGKLLIAP